MILFRRKKKTKRDRRRQKYRREMAERELIEKDILQEYAQVIEMFGNCRLKAFCFDGKMRKCLIRGNMRKKVWVHIGDTILISVRTYQDGKADVIATYTYKENYKLNLPELQLFNGYVFAGFFVDSSVYTGDFGDP